MKKIFLLAGVAMLLSWSMSAEEITGGTVDGADKVTAEKRGNKTYLVYKFGESKRGSPEAEGWHHGLLFRH